jgi:hypothetical protein
MDEYFMGSNVVDYERGKAVIDILDTLVAELERDPRRKFTCAEMKFFTMWYYKLKQKDKDRVKKLVHAGQL